MRILWITNNLLPDICEYLGLPVVVKTGWLHSAANQIKSELELSVAALYSGDKLRFIKLNGINYILVPSRRNNKKLDKNLIPLWQAVRKQVNPSVVHIHGTEYPTGLLYIMACGSKGVVISIQGLVSECKKYYNSGLCDRDILRYTTFRDLIRGETLWKQAGQFFRQGKYELEYICRVRHFIGRTAWDEAHILANNKTATYYLNNETLRSIFYTQEWSLEKVTKYTIFFSQATYPLKGLHRLLAAMPIILEYFPETRIIVAGFDLTKACSSSFKGRFRGTTYGFYLSSLICKYNLKRHIRFVGQQSEKDICNLYLNSHVYVNASALENSSNSIGEAQLLGIPVVASFVGGTDTMVENNKTGLLYPLDDTVRLAFCVIRLFGDDTLALRLSENGKKQARMRHDRELNKIKLLKIYNKISDLN